MRRITEKDAGCWIDETNGIDTHPLVAELALDLGWYTVRDKSRPRRPDATRRGNTRESRYQRGEIRAIIAAFRAGHDTTVFRGAVIDDVPGIMINQGGIGDEATDYLNTLAPDGYAFGWHEGNLFLQSAEWWQEEG